MTCAIAALIIRIINIMTNYSQSNKCVKFDVTIFTLDESPKVTPFALMSDTADAVKVIVCGSPLVASATFVYCDELTLYGTPLVETINDETVDESLFRPPMIVRAEAEQSAVPFN